jgi:hypothetical protein
MGTRTIEYGPYEIVCAATPAAGGFAASAVVAISHGDAREETPVPLAGPATFDTEDAALDHAAAGGQAWVDENG